METNKEIHHRSRCFCGRFLPKIGYTFCSKCYIGWTIVKIEYTENLSDLVPQEYRKDKNEASL